MEEYHKIQTVFKRDPATNHKTLLEAEYSLPEFAFLKDNQWVFTEKVDGTNTRVMFDGTSITFGGKTDRAQMPPQLVARLNEIFSSREKDFQDVFKGRNVHVCLYGEGYGAKIQKGGGKYRPDQGFVLFDVKIGDWWLQRKDVEDVAAKLDLEIVPVIGEGPLAKMVEMVRNGFDSAWGQFKAEGIVARPATELKTRNGQRIITKLKYRDFV